jgi:hypothetical protein
MFRHPKYYKELRKRNRDLSELQQVKLERSVPQSDQAISEPSSTEQVERAPGPGLKRQATSRKPQAPSDKHQAPSDKPQA